MFKSLSLAGLPALGTPAFRAEVARFNVQQAVGARVAAYDDRLTDHSRGGGFRLRTDTRQLVNRVIRLFRAEYPKAIASARGELELRPVAVTEELSGEALLSLLHMRGALSELRLEHPSLPFVGIIDLVRLGEDGVTVVDFKTGEPKDVHRRQVTLYAVLWWRRTGQVPSAVEARYPGRVASFSVSLDDLYNAEDDLSARINKLTNLLENPPAMPRPGEQCRYCDVRQFCDVYWDNNIQELPARQASHMAQPSIDIELTVCGQPSGTGFEAQSRNGRACTVVHSADGWKVHSPFIAGEALRILNARLAEDESTLELMPWTEVFHR